MKTLRRLLWGMAIGMPLTAVVTPAMAADLSPAGCQALARTGMRWPDRSTRIASATPQPARPAAAFLAPAGPPTADPQAVVPTHCELIGVIGERTGMDGRRYAIRFRLRLPAVWNGRFLFQGGGGTNGEIGDALGHQGAARPLALAQGYAVVSQDSGHENGRNDDPARGGRAAFGFDATARANYGHASLIAVAQAAKAAIRSFYGTAPSRSYFFGCSKGGEEGMAVVQRYPQAFDGVVAGAPGFSLPRAAVTQVWNVQTFAPLGTMVGAKPQLADLARAFSDNDLKIVAGAVLAACDADDGLRDGIVGAFAACTTRRVEPVLRSHVCRSGKQDDCLSSAQVDALLRWQAGPRDAKGQPIYSDWAWDAGIAAPNWRSWQLGIATRPALNVLTGGSSLSAMFTTPPTAVADDPAAMFDWEMRFDVPHDYRLVYAIAPGFPRSAWADMSARSPDLSAFVARGGKLIVPQGVSDPVFSINDTITWYRQVDARLHGRAAGNVRLFAVPGMTHCAGGPSTDDVDMLGALVAWVEQEQAPERITARSTPAGGLPPLERPLCPYPAIARYDGRGDQAKAESFTCA